MIKVAASCAAAVLAFIGASGVVAQEQKRQAPAPESQQQSKVNTTKSNTKDRVAAPPESGVMTALAPSTFASEGFTVTGTYSDGGTRFFEVSSAVDSDGNGYHDTGVLRTACEKGEVVSAFFQARDGGRGLATERRQFQPLVVRKEVDRRSNIVGKKLTWDLTREKGIQENGIKRAINEAGVRRTLENSQVKPTEEWSEVRIKSGATGLCL